MVPGPVYEEDVALSKGHPRVQLQKWDQLGTGALSLFCEEGCHSYLCHQCLMPVHVVKVVHKGEGI